MKNQYTSAHRFFIVSGFILIVLTCTLSCFRSIGHTTTNGWTMETRSTQLSFFPPLFLFLGMAETFLLFAKKVFLRIIAVILTLVKLFVPWCLLSALNGLGQLMMDSSSSYKLVSFIPYAITALSALLLILHVIMLFAIPHKKLLQPSKNV